MKIYPNGLIILDAVDIISLGLLLGYSTARIIKMLNKYYSNKSEDPLVSELKKISPVKEIKKDKPLNVSVRYFPRGGEVKGFLLDVKSKRIGKLIVYLLKITKRMRELKRVRTSLILLNILLFKKLGIAFVAEGSITYFRLIVLASSSYTIGALLALMATPGGFIFVLGPILTLIIRSEYVPIETVNRCRLLCEAIEKYYNKKLELEMKSFTPGLETPFNVNSEQGPFQCTGEGKLYQRYLKDKEKIENQVQYFNEFKVKFPQCNDATVEEIKSEIEEISANFT
uniref:Uncharacterized protein n=1 Tax=Cylindrotheca closterium TaxID=2856 RepID=A0A023HAF5_9STRA|nr:hypothetical protein [Cylindrotheca closterium]AGH28615.1 hypothetical protein [Cylindrotheca closterium]